MPVEVDREAENLLFSEKRHTPQIIVQKIGKGNFLFEPFFFKSRGHLLTTWIGETLHFEDTQAYRF